MAASRQSGGDFSVNRTIHFRRDYYAGGFIALLGACAILQGLQYEVGTLAQTGPGAFPIILGMALILVGMLIAGTAAMSNGADTAILPTNPPWFGWFCILAGPMCFIVLGHYAGMVPAIFACVFVCAIGDKAATLKSSFVLALIMTVFGTLLFGFVLNIQFPLLVWD